MRIEGVSAVVTGAASGLGLATAKALADRGAAVTLVDLPTADGDSALARVHGRAQFAPADIADQEQVASAIATAASFGPLRAVVHCAGRGGDRKRILDREGNPSELDSFEHVLRVNLIGTYNVLRLGASAMAKNDAIDGDRGAFVLTASVAAFDGQIGQTAYTAAKAGVHGMTIVAARDLASWQIRVNTIAPGTFETPMLGRFPDDMREALVANVPHPKRLGQPDEYAHLAIEMLANPYLNGCTVRLDGAVRMPPR